MTGPVCPRCGRHVNRRGRDQICSNCRSLANSAVCGTCGEYRRVAGRGREGRPWCYRCRHGYRNRIVDEERRRLIIERVTAADASLNTDMVCKVLAETVTTRRSLRRLAIYMDEHPDVFSVGPTSMLPILDRFTRALVDAGAQKITTIHPACDGCGRRQPRHARSTDGQGVLCSACWARTHKEICGLCGREGRVVVRDRDGSPMCELCRLQARRRSRLDELNGQIVAVLADTVRPLNNDQVIGAVEQTAPKIPDRSLLLEQLRDGSALDTAARRPVIVARFVAELRQCGAELPAAVCADCDQPSEPLFVHGGAVRCYGCERRRDIYYRRGSDTQVAQQIVDSVIAADPTLPETVVRQVLAETVPARRALPRLAGHIAAHPEVFSVGPTTTDAVVDRFTRALVAAGAQTIRTVEPVCEGCGKRRPRAARTATGGLCGSCSHKRVCAACGQIGRSAERHPSGGVVCQRCVNQRRSFRRLEEFTERIATVVIDAQPNAAPPLVTAAIERVAPDLSRRRFLAEQLETGPSLTGPAGRCPLVALLLSDLRARGVLLPAAVCADCDGPAEPLFIHRQVVRCNSCATHCPRCGHARSRPAEVRCRWCITGPPAPTCSQCGRSPRLGLTDDGRCCRQCRQQAEHYCSRCGKTSQLTRQLDRWICHRCALAVDLDDRLGPADRLPPNLLPVRAAIAAADNPAIVRRWLRTTTGAQLLARLAVGEFPLTHDALDQAGPDRSVEYLRALLVASGALPEEDRILDRLEQFFERSLDTAVADPADRKTVRAWLRWQVLPRLRRRAAAGKSTAHSANNARRALHSVVELLDGLHRRGLNLQGAAQADVDRWFAQPGAACWLARPFLAWVRQRRHLNRQIQLPPTPAATQPATDDTARWEVARRLVNDNTLAVDDRVAAALVVLYGQSLSRIVRLTTDHIHTGSDGAVTVNLDGNRMPIHEPFAALIRELPLRRTHGPADQIASRWLFPGRHAGQPLGAVVLGNRMRAIGVESRNMRNSARAQLVTQIPPAVLGQLIAINPTTASRWATITNSNWNAYAGRSRQA